MVGLTRISRVEGRLVDIIIRRHPGTSGLEPSEELSRGGERDNGAMLEEILPHAELISHVIEGHHVTADSGMSRYGNLDVVSESFSSEIRHLLCCLR